jgi:hypothetical protein
MLWLPGVRLAEITGRGLPIRFGGTAISTPLATSFSSTRISSGERLARAFFFGIGVTSAAGAALSVPHIKQNRKKHATIAANPSPCVMAAIF